MRIALDTNAYVAFCKEKASVVRVIQAADEVALPFIVLGELKAGFACGTQAKSNEKVLAQFLRSSRVSVLYADTHTLHHYGNLFAQLKVAGRPIPTNDLWIASLALQHQCELVTLDKHFEVIPQLAICPL